MNDNKSEMHMDHNEGELQTESTENINTNTVNLSQYSSPSNTTSSLNTTNDISTTASTSSTVDSYLIG